MSAEQEVIRLRCQRAAIAEAQFVTGARTAYMTALEEARNDQ